jgi:predicted amidohydrolase
MKIALVQMFCPWGEAERNIAVIAEFSRQARANSAEMAVFPELTVTGIFKDKRVWQLAEALEGPSVRRVRDIARREKLFIAFGFTEKSEPLPFNAYCIASPEGRLIGVYRKNFIPPLETPFWQGHNERPIFSVAGKRFAVATCWDCRQEELLAHYSRERADIVLMPHAWDADPVDRVGQDLKYNTMDGLIEHHRNGRLGGWKNHDAMRAQFYGYIPRLAQANKFCALFVNQCGQPHETLKFVGPTFAVSPEGKIVAETKDDAEQILYVEVP